MYHILIVIGTIFHCKQAILIFFSKFSQKGGFLSQPGVVNIIIKFDVFQLIWVWTLFDLKQTVKICWTKFTQKNGIFSQNTYQTNITGKFRKLESVQTPISTFKEQFCNFGTKFTNKGYFPPKAAQMKITTKFGIFKLHQVPTFIFCLKTVFLFQSRTTHYHQIQEAFNQS